MTANEDELFLEIMRAHNKSPNDIAVEKMLIEFANIYREKVKAKEFKADPFVWEIVKQIIPEYFL
jgi:hypothetical protein